MPYHHKAGQPDYGTGKKNLGIYLTGLIICSILTLAAFGTVMANALTKWQTFAIIYSAACIQFLVQIVCFLRLNTQTEQGRINVMSFIFTGVILGSIVVGSIWIMWNCNFNMMY
jgi:cytochrome o ubiquinol oxidase operon protein cyoD